MLPKNEARAKAYEAELSKGKQPDASKVDSALIDLEGNLLAYDGGSMDEIRSLALERIETKNVKAIKRRQANISSHELALVIDDGCLFCCPNDFAFLLEAFKQKKWLFCRIFIITASNFFIIDQRGIIEKPRVYTEN